MNRANESPTIAVTGATGYVGTRVVDVLRTAHPEWNVRALSHTGQNDAISDPIFEHVDVRDRVRLENALDGADVVLHLAAISGVTSCEENPSLAYEVNVQGTNNIGWFCRKTETAVVFPFSMAVIGTPEKIPITVDSPREPMNRYGLMKLLGERAIETFARDSFPAHLFLKSNVYGEYTVNGQRMSKSTVTNFFVDRALSGQSLPVYEPGSQSRDYVHIHDIADAYLRSTELLLDELANGRTGTRGYEIASGTQLSVLELAKLVQRTVETETGTEPAIELVANPRDNETLTDDLEVDITTSKSELGWEPTHSIQASVRRLVRQKTEQRS
ncbi:NAD-dependent epimerase/dehydratase family protein [Haladaptatus cibarius]|uniref:NAD-dependent epimerase/dehydratase family protein n=1 Tax=Haladaptatus cibarius TaxID=453847 RepID=UPI000679D864|nr:NAD-dependent epimerase/dehydratase family protein [Haladaptatus cibarius]